MKKSQFELFGLAIVIVIIIMATLFVVVLYLNKKPSETRKSFAESELASGMINTLINIEVSEQGCPKMKMSDLIRMCSSEGTSSAVSSVCTGKTACKAAEDVILRIFPATIEKWTASENKPEKDKNYYFAAYTNDPNSPKIKRGNSCRNNKKYKEYILPGTPPVHVVLELCS